MKSEWEALQNDPSQVDEKIRAQLEMLEQINNNAFVSEKTGEAGEELKTNPTEIGRIMKDMMRNQRQSAENGSSVTVEYRSKGEAFQDP